MGYRKPEPHRHHKHDIEDVATAGRILVTNGNVNTFAIPCYYYPTPIKPHNGPHCRDMHDHLGWPQPGHPDESCQDQEFFGYPVEGYIPKHGPKQIKDVKTVPIHLSEEGYTAATVSLSNSAPAGLEMSASIDPQDDWIVRVQVSAECEEAVCEPVECRAAVRVTGPGRTDTLGVFKVIILPAPIS